MKFWLLNLFLIPRISRKDRHRIVVIIDVGFTNRRHSKQSADSCVLEKLSLQVVFFEDQPQDRIIWYNSRDPVVLFEHVMYFNSPRFKTRHSDYIYTNDYSFHRSIKDLSKFIHSVGHRKCKELSSFALSLDKLLFVPHARLTEISQKPKTHS